MKNFIIPIFVPHLGCPNQCVFCNQRSISGEQKEIRGIDVQNIVNQYLNTIPQGNFVEIAFYGGSFTGIEFERQKELLEAANNFILDGRVNEVRVSTRPDYINKEVLELLQQFGVRTIELGVQSMDDEVLNLSARGHSGCDVINASDLITQFGFRLGHQMMIGLPGDTIEKDISTAKQLIAFKPEIVRIYPVIVIKGTELERMYKNGVYIPLTIKEAVEISKELLKLFRKNDIKVIRLGLQVTENINYGKDVVAGPFHPAFKELVEAEIRFDMIADTLDKLNLSPGKELNIIANEKEISATVGHKKGNLQKLYAKYSLKKIKVSKDGKINRGQAVIIVDGNEINTDEYEYIKGIDKKIQVKNCKLQEK